MSSSSHMPIVGPQYPSITDKQYIGLAGIPADRVIMANMLKVYSSLAYFKLWFRSSVFCLFVYLRRIIQERRFGCSCTFMSHLVAICARRESAPDSKQIQRVNLATDGRLIPIYPQLTFPVLQPPSSLYSLLVSGGACYILPPLFTNIWTQGFIFKTHSQFNPYPTPYRPS